MSRSAWKVLVLASALSLVTFAAAGVARGHADSFLGAAHSARSSAGGELTFARASEPVSFNPLQSNGDAGSLWNMVYVYDNLVQYRPGSSLPQPDLAQSWRASSDGLTYTFRLRTAKFSNGMPVTAADVKFTLDRFANPKTNPGYAFLAESIKSTSTQGSRVLIVHLKHRDAEFIDALTVPGVAGIYPKAVFEKEGDSGLAKHPVGAGPFMLKSWIRGKEVELVRNPYYWRAGVPSINTIHMMYVPTDTTRLLEISSGQADVAEGVPYSQIEQVQAQSGVRLVIAPIWSYDAIWLNHKYGPFSDRNVRQALNYALDKNAINKAVYDGKAEVANSTIAKGEFWDASVPSYGYDLAKAKQLIAQSRYPHGFSATLSVPSGDTTHKEVAVIAKDAWAKLGVKVSIVTQDPGTLFTQYSKGNYQASIPLPLITADIGAPDELGLAWLQYTPGYQSFFTFYRNNKVASLVRAANRTLSTTTRAALWRKIQRLSMADAPWVPMFFTPSVTAVRDNVKNFSTLQAGWWYLPTVSVAK
jgi:peptide/nickel transport system substrate-binding protein